MANPKKFIFISLLLFIVVDASAFTTTKNITFNNKTVVYNGIGLEDFNKLVKIEELVNFSNCGKEGNWENCKNGVFTGIETLDNVNYNDLDFNFNYPITRINYGLDQGEGYRFAFRLNTNLINRKPNVVYTEAEDNSNSIMAFTYDFKNKDDKNFYILNYGAVLYNNTTNTALEALEKKNDYTFSIVSIADNVIFTADLDNDSKIKGLTTNTNELRGQYNNYFLNGTINVNEGKILNANLISNTEGHSDAGKIIFNKNSSLIYSVISNLNSLQFNGDNNISTALQIYKNNGVNNLGTYFKVDDNVNGNKYILNEFTELGVYNLNKLEVLAGILNYDKSISYEIVEYGTDAINVRETKDTDMDVLVKDGATLKVFDTISLGAIDSKKTVSGKGTVELAGTESRVRIKIDNLGVLRFGNSKDTNEKEFNVGRQLLFGGNNSNSVNTMELISNKILQYNKDIVFNKGDKEQAEVILGDNSKLVLATNARIDGDSTIKLTGLKSEVEFSRNSYAKIGTLNVKTATFNDTVNNNISNMIGGVVDNNNSVVAVVDNMFVNGGNLTLDKKVQAKMLELNDFGSITAKTLLSSNEIKLNNGNLILSDNAIISSFDEMKTLTNNNAYAVNNCADCKSEKYINVTGDSNSNVIFTSGSAVMYANLNTTGDLEFRSNADLSKVIKGSINVNSLNIADNATLNFNRTTDVFINGDMNIGSNSTLKLNLNGGTIKVGNDVRFANNGTSTLLLNNFEILEAETIYVNNAKLDIIIDAERDSNFVGGERQIFIGDVVGDFNIVNTHTGNYIVQAVEGDKKKVKILMASSQNRTSAKSTNSNVNPVVANVINRQTNNSVLNSIASKLEQDYLNGDVSDEVDTLTDNDNSTTVSVATETFKQLNSVVSNRLGSLPSAGRSASSDSEAKYDDLAIWIKGVYSKAELKDTNESYGFKSNMAGAVVGFEGQINDYIKLGAGYMYSNGDIKRTTSRNLDVKSHTGFLYGELSLKSFFVNGVVAYTKSTYDQNKTIYNETLTSKYNAKTMSAQVMFGYNLSLGSFILAPQAGVRFMNVNQDAYNDGLADIEKAKVNSATAIAGVRVATIIDTYSSVKVKPVVYVNATNELNNDNERSGSSSYKSRKTRVAKLSNGTTFDIVDRRIDPFGVEVGAGLNLEFGKSFELSLNYDGNFRKKYTEHTGTFGLKYKF